MKTTQLLKDKPMKDKRKQGGGTVMWRSGRAAVKLSLGVLGRRTLALPTCKTPEEAERRCSVLAELAGKLNAAGQMEVGFAVLERAASAEGRDLDAAVKLVDALVKGDAVVRPHGSMTFRQLGEKWTSGELAKLFPDHIKAKGTSNTDVSRLKTYVYPFTQEVPVERFSLAHAQEVMRRIPPDRSPGTRRHVALLMHRMCAMAVFPMQLIQTNPLPPGFLPSVGAQKAKAYLYPDEDRRLLCCKEVPLGYRMLYGFLDREGMRSDEAAVLEWTDFNLEHGAIRLDHNKTNDPRAWALEPGTTRAIRAWRAYRRASGETGPLVFPVSFEHAAARFRKHVKAAGIDRPELFAQNSARLRLRLHDTRATFVTIGLANGRTETWIADRTGHKSSTMINRYRRAARSVAELNLGDLIPLDIAVPELAPFLDSHSLATPVVPTLSQRGLHQAGVNLKNPYFYWVGHEGLEPSANGLRVHCSTN